MPAGMLFTNRNENRAWSQVNLNSANVPKRGALLGEATIIRFGHTQELAPRANAVECNICLAQFQLILMCYISQGFQGPSHPRILKVPRPSLPYRTLLTNFLLLLVLWLLHLCIKISQIIGSWISTISTYDHYSVCYGHVPQEITAKLFHRNA